MTRSIIVTALLLMFLLPACQMRPRDIPLPPPNHCRLAEWMRIKTGNECVIEFA
jgi:hypothetical protein